MLSSHRFIWHSFFVTCHDSVMFCLFAYIFKILYSSRVTLPLNLSKPIFKISKNGAKQLLKGWKESLEWMWSDRHCFHLYSPVRWRIFGEVDGASAGGHCSGRVSPKEGFVGWQRWRPSITDQQVRYQEQAPGMLCIIQVKILGQSKKGTKAHQSYTKP